MHRLVIPLAPPNVDYSWARQVYRYQCLLPYGQYYLNVTLADLITKVCVTERTCSLTIIIFSLKLYV